MSFVRRRLSPYPLCWPPDKFPKRYKSSATSRSLSLVLDSCKTVRNLKQIHAHIILRGAEQDNLLTTRFVCLCNSFSRIRYATAVFDRVSRPNIFLWNSIINGYCRNSVLCDTILLFKRMKRSDISPDCFTFPSLLKACANELAIREGKAVHCAVVKGGVDADLFVQTGLIDLYGKCMEVSSARKVFDEMSERNVVSWTALIVGYVNCGEIGSARDLFNEMPKKNVASWNAMVDGCAKSGDLVSARKFFDDMPERNAVSYTSLIDGYAKAGDMASARFLFDQCPERDIVSWSALVTGYVQNGQPNEAIKLFIEMRSRNVKPDEFIMVSLMSACSQVGCLELAKWVDSFVSESAIDLNQVHVSAALIDMNAKCGNMERALWLFERMRKRDLISYCSVIQGLSIHGHGAVAIGLFSRMLEEGLTPDIVAFTVILNACSQAGLVEEGCRYFESMKNTYGILPSSDHYACMVDLLGRAGCLKEAYELIKSMPIEPHASAWGALLGACRLHGDIELGEIIAGHLIDIEPQNASNYILLSNIYAAADRWSDVSHIRMRMRYRGVRKIPGCSWV